MSDTDRLKDKLAKLGEPAQLASGSRRVAAADATAFLRAVLVEIDETVLARKLTFHNEADALISFDVANRRLHRLTDAPAELANSTEGLIGQQFSETGEDLIPPLTELLTAFFAASQQIHVGTARLQDGLDPGNVGCAAEVIAAASSVVLYEDKPLVSNERVDNFVKLGSSIAKAWVWSDENGVRESGGDDSTVQSLTVLAQSSFADFDKQLNSTFNTTPHCVIVGATDNGTQSVLYVKSGGQDAFMAIPTESIAEAHRYWRQSQA